MKALRRLGRSFAVWFGALTQPSRIPPERRTPLWPVKGWILAAAFAALAASMFLADAFLATQARQLPNALREAFVWITWFGRYYWFLCPTGILLLVLGASRWRELPRFPQGVIAAVMVRAGFIFLAVGFSALAVAFIKAIIGRARPNVGEIVNPYAYDPFIWDPSYSSLPSGHATNAFAAAVAIGALWPKARAPMWIFAIVIAISRVIVSAHFPSDVIAGAIAGTVGALLVRSWFAARRLGFAVGPDGVIHHMPGPSWRRVKQAVRGLAAR